MSTIYTSQTLTHHLPLSNEASGYLHKKRWDMLTSTVDIMPKLLTHQWLANKFFSTNEQTKKICHNHVTSLLILSEVVLSSWGWGSCIKKQKYKQQKIKESTDKAQMSCRRKGKLCWHCNKSIFSFWTKCIGYSSLMQHCSHVCQYTKYLHPC